MWELDCKESWAPKNWCFWTVVLEKTLESPLDCKEIQPVHRKGNQSWILIWRTDAEAETPVTSGQQMQRTDAFELWCWRWPLRVPWTARRSNQSILKEISPGCLLERRCWSWNSNTLTTWCKELTPMKRPWCWERLRAGEDRGDRG